MSRRPDYDVSALNKSTSERGRIGAAWANNDGTISIVLDPFVFVPTNRDTLITLFPKKDKKGEATVPSPKSTLTPRDLGYGDDDIPP